MDGPFVDGHKANGPKGHVALNQLLCELQENPNGNDLQITTNPSLADPNMNRILL